MVSLATLDSVSDLHDLWLITYDMMLTYELIEQASSPLRDEELLSVRMANACQIMLQVDSLGMRID